MLGQATKTHPIIIEFHDGERIHRYIEVTRGQEVMQLLNKNSGFIEITDAIGDTAYISLRYLKAVYPWIEEKERMEAARRNAQAESARRKAAADRSQNREDKSQSNTNIKLETLMEGLSPEQWIAVNKSLKALQLDESSLPRDIHAAYRKLVKQYHPDRIRGEGGAQHEIEKAASKMAELNNAFRNLNNAFPEIEDSVKSKNGS